MQIFFALCLIALTGLSSLACVAENSERDPQAPDHPDPSQRAINTHCPRSGKPVVGSSLAYYRGHVVGFCNTHCRDDFAAHIEERPKDRAFFDDLLPR